MKIFIILGYVEKISAGGENLAAVGGMSHDDTAVLAGVLAGLATFLFLALPILCCLCPLPFACCGGGGAGKKAAAAGAGTGAQKRKNIHEFSRYFFPFDILICRHDMCVL